MYQTNRKHLFPVIPGLSEPNVFSWQSVELIPGRWNLIVSVTLNKNSEEEFRSVIMLSELARLSELVSREDCEVKNIDLLSPTGDGTGYILSQLASVRAGRSGIENRKNSRSRWAEFIPVGEKPIIFHEHLRTNKWEVDESDVLYSIDNCVQPA